MLSHEDAKLLPLAAVGIGKGLLEVYVAPAIKELRPSEKAWALGAIAVICYDVLAPDGETLSERYSQFVDDHPALAWGAVAITAGHLLDIIPEKIDPIHNLAKVARAI